MKTVEEYIKLSEDWLNLSINGYEPDKLPERTSLKLKEISAIRAQAYATLALTVSNIDEESTKSEAIKNICNKLNVPYTELSIKEIDINEMKGLPDG